MTTKAATKAASKAAEEARNKAREALLNNTAGHEGARIDVWCDIIPNVIRNKIPT